MIRTLRGLWDRRWVLGPLLLVAAIAVAGTATVTAFAEGVGVRIAFAAPVLLLAVLAVPAVARDLAIARRPEIGQARMRGVHGLRLVAFLAVEPLLVLVVGGLLGLVLGRVVVRVARHLFDLTAAPTGATEAWLLGAVVSGGLVAVLLGMAATAREPLARQLGTPVRRPSGSLVVLFGQLLVLCAAAFACYQASTADPAADAEDGAGWLLLAGPALVGLSVGLVTVWLVRAVAGALASSRRHRRFASFLAVRRLARGTDLNGALGFVVAAGVVVGVAASGQHAIGGWTDQTAQLRTGAPLRVEVPGGALAALDLSREVDPDGRWLMAGVVVHQGSSRFAYVDSARYPRVVGDALDDTPAADLSDDVAALAAGSDEAAVSVAHAEQLEVRVSSPEPGARWHLGVTYVNDEDYTEEVLVRRGIPADGRVHTVDLPRCAGGCSFTTVLSDPSEDPLVVSRLQAGDVDLLASGLSRPSGKQLARDDAGLRIPPGRRHLTLHASAADAPLPVLVAGRPDGPPLSEVVTSGGERRPAQAQDEVDALPLVEAEGVLGDLPRALLGASQSGRGATAVVLARADTPRAVLDELPGPARGPGELRDNLTERVGAERGTLYLFVGLWSLLLAVPVLASATARARRNQRQEAAALRVTGVPLADVRRAGRRQWTILAVAGVLATVAGGALGSWLLADGLRLVAVPAGSVPVPGWVSWPVLYGGGAALVLLLGAAAVTATRGEGTSRPALLREEATR